MKDKTPLWARVVSRLFDPIWEVPAAILLAVAFAIQEGLRWRFLGILLFVDGVVPGVFFLTMLYHKQITSWDIRDRLQRIPIYLFTMICHLGGIWLAYNLGKVELAKTLLVYLVIAAFYVGVTLFWKISLHAGVNALLVTSLNMFYDWKYWYLYIIVLVVAVARHVGRHHTTAQLVAGASFGIVLTYVGLRMAGW